MTHDAPPTTVLRIAAKGDGVTEDGRHIPLSAPGDHISAHGEVHAGPHHVAAPCRHYPQCGGCQLQHVDEESLGDFVRDRVANALDGQDLTAEQLMPVHLSPPLARRRAAMRAMWLHGKVVIGFSEKQTHRLIDFRECPMMHPDLFAMVQPVRALLSQHMGRRDTVQVKLARTDQGIDLVIENLKLEGLAVHEALTDFAQTHRLARLSVDSGYGPETRWEPAPVTVTLGGVPVPYPPFAFLQATDDGETALLAAVREIVGDAKLVADLFAGLGTFAFGLGEGRKIYAAEADRTALLALQSAANRAGRHIVAEHRDLFRRPLTVQEIDRFGAIILDPPRSGAREQSIQLASAKAPVIAYVSCNPSSFARDARQLVDGGYRLGRVWPVGQFRWSTHVELVAEFRR